MSEKRSDADPTAPTRVDRRHFLIAAGAAGALPLAAGPAFAAAQPAANDGMAMKMGPAAKAATPAADAAAAKSLPAGYQFFNIDESGFIEAVVDVLIPHDDTGPGALELGVNTYIDRQMAGAYGKGYRLYLDGPYGEGVPEQGYQLPLIPSQLIRAGIADVDAYAQSSQGDFFASLSADKQAAVLKDVESGKAKLATVPAAVWFGELLELTVEGYLGDPLYGGNKDKGSWKMIGFPGANAMYADKIEPFRNKPYAFTPEGIQDLI